MFNCVVLMGNLTKDPELRVTSTGVAVANFSMATNRKYGDKQETFFTEVAVWNKMAEAVNKHLTKGSGVLVRGRLKTESWDSDAGKRTKTVVIAEEIKFVGKRKSGAGSAPEDEGTDMLGPF